MTFQNYAERHLGSEFFATSVDDPKSDLFHASLESARALFAWTHGLKNRDGHPFDLYPGFIDDMRPNALADTWEGKQFIAMHSSLFVCINEFALFCFTQKEFFADVGQPELEASPVPWDERVPGIWLLEFTSEGRHVEDAHSRQLIPKDGTRYIAAIYLAQLMARFAWLHELAHCFNGHVAYARRHDLATRLYELADPLFGVAVVKTRSTPEQTATLQCLELDADQSALWGSFNIQWKALETLEGIAALEAGLRLRLTLFGAYAMIWLIEQFQRYLDTQHSVSHPPSSLRLQNLFRTAAAQIVPHDPALGTLHADVLQQFDVVRAAIPRMYGTGELIDRIQDGPLMETLSAFDPHLDEMKANLRAFEYSDKN